MPDLDDCRIDLRLEILKTYMELTPENRAALMTEALRLRDNQLDAL